MKNHPLILVTDRFDYSLRILLSQIKEADCRYQEDLFINKKLLAKAEIIIIRTGTKIDRDFLRKTSSLKFIITGTSGFDHIDLKATGQKGVRCFHLPDIQTRAVTELTFFMILAVCRKIPLAWEQIQRGVWERQFLLGEEIGGQRLGIVGLGRVGGSVARIAKAFGMEVSAFDPYLEKSQSGVSMLGFEELMKSSDIVSFHVPKTKKTRQMIKRETLQWMSPCAKLINMSRGDVVNQKDLINHLEENPHFKVGLDVFQAEPLSLDSPLLKFQNVVLTPHIGGSTEESLKESSKLALKKALDLLRGQKTDGELPPRVPWYED